MFEVKILLDTKKIEPEKIEKWVTRISDIISVKIYTRDSPEWNALYIQANIPVNPTYPKFPIPKCPGFCYIVDYESLINPEGMGFAYYYKDGGFALSVAADDTERIMELRFLHEFLHYVGMPADAMSYYYCCEVSTILETVMYLILGCNPFSCIEKHPSKPIAQMYQSNYYDALFKMVREHTPITWSNSDKPKWK